MVTGDSGRSFGLEESTFDLLFLKSPQPMWIYALESMGFLEVNNAAIAAYGYSREQFLAMRIADIRPSEEIPRLMDEVAGFRANLRSSGTWRHRKADGSIIEVEITSHVLTWAGVRAAMVLVHDVTERRQLERTLREREAHLRTIVEQSPIGICQVDVTGRYVTTNSAFEGMLGYTKAELECMTFADVTHPDDVDKDAGLFEEIAHGEREGYQLEKRYVRKHGTELWAQITVRRVRTQEGTFLFDIGMVEDISDRKRAEEELRVSERRYRALFESSPVGIFLVDRHGTMIDANPAFQQLLGYCAEELYGRHWTDLTYPDDVEAEMKLDREMNEGVRTNYQLDKRLLPKDGLPIWVRLTASDVGRIAAGDFQFSIGMIEDITERKRAHEALERVAAIVESTHDAVIGKTLDGAITNWNLGAEHLYGYTTLEAIGRHISNIVPEDRVDELAEVLQRVASGKTVTELETVRRHKDGHLVDVSITVSPIRAEDGTVVGASTIARDVGARKIYEAQLQHQALHDALTGLPNRTLFLDRLSQTVLLDKRYSQPTAVLLLDLDRFKEVNDTIGHHTGDELIRLLGQRFRAQLRDSDTLARLGGDEFGAILLNSDDEGGIAAASKLLASLSEPFTVDGWTMDLTANIGIAVSPQHGRDAAALLRHAEVAMYRAKRIAGGYAVYETGTDQHDARRLTLSSGLRQAIEGNQLILHYQPKVDLRSGYAGHVEALVRWIHPQYGFVPPDEFIGAAERVGLIKPLTTWVLTEALGQIAAWADAGVHASVGVNLSPRSLHDPELVDTIVHVLRARGLPATSLQLEITESTIMIDPERAMIVLRALRDMGVKIAIDDFGTGFSSMAYLMRLPLDEIKIDRSFVLDMMAGGHDAPVIVRSIIDLGHNLGLSVTAEGIEAQPVLDLLGTMGCDLAQGYYLSRPIPADDAFLWLRDRAPRREVSRTVA